VLSLSLIRYRIKSTESYLETWLFRKIINLLIIGEIIVGHLYAYTDIKTEDLSALYKNSST
jgi:hypothetical protein